MGRFSDHQDRFRDIVRWNSLYGTHEDSRSFSLEKRVSGDSQFLDKCRVKQSGIVVSEEENCSDALDEFEDLIKR